jgi:hypothetical protein
MDAHSRMVDHVFEALKAGFPETEAGEALIVEAEKVAPDGYNARLLAELAAKRRK